jgi:hypothetical protein
MRVLAFDDPQLDGRYEWLIEDGGNVHMAMRALARQAYRRNRRHLPDVSLSDRLRAHGSVDARPYSPPTVVQYRA